VAEGSPVDVTFSSPSDPSSADTAAGFRYEYRCDGSAFPGAPDYATADHSATHQCTFDDGPSTHTVRARIIDKDGGTTPYTTSVTVANVAPKPTLNPPPPVHQGWALHLPLTSPSDPSAAHTA